VGNLISYLFIVKIPHLSETERIVVLMMIGYGDRKRSCAEVMTFFNEIHPNRQPISRSTVTRTWSRFNETGSVKERPKSGRPKIVTNDENSLNVMLDVVENFKTSVQQLALNHNMSRRSIQNL
jgi:transposase